MNIHVLLIITHNYKCTIANSYVNWNNKCHKFDCIFCVWLYIIVKIRRNENIVYIYDFKLATIYINNRIVHDYYTVLTDVS